MRAIGVLLVSLGAIGAGFWLVSIMGSGPCEPPPCGSTVGEPCQQTCNGTGTYTCQGTPPAELECRPGAPCDSAACPAAPPCYKASCVNPTICGGSAGAVCCRYDFEDDAKCPTGDDDPAAAEDTWSGVCNADSHQCVAGS
jgi:hypothetical protein